MATRRVATVFGGAGFIGRYLLRRLTREGYVVRIAGRDPEAAAALKPLGAVGQIAPLYAPVTNEPAVARAVEGADLVVNLVGILAEQRAGDFRRIHGEGAGRIARLAAASGVHRLVHLSAIGADPSAPSAYGRSKAAGEAAVRQAMADAVILRPSVVFGLEDKFFNRFAGLATMLPVMPVIAGGTRLQPVFVGDVADAIMVGLTSEEARGRTYELGGPRAYTMRELIVWILRTIDRPRPLYEVGAGMARLQARIGELLPGKPFTRDQLAMLSRDNVATGDGLAALGIVATPIDLVVPDYLRRYRPGGRKRTTVELPEKRRSGPNEGPWSKRNQPSAQRMAETRQVC